MERVLSLEGRSKAAMAALVVVILADVFAIWVDVREIQLMNRIVDGNAPALSELEASDDRQAAAGLILVVTLVAAVVAFIMWFHRAYKNLSALGATGLRYGTGWAIGAWFVPFLNLWRPKQIANDIWRASDPSLRPDQGIDWRERPVPGFLTAWWVVWIVSIYAWSISTRLYFTGEEAEDIRNADYADLASLGLDIVAAVLAIYVVMRMTRRQSDRARNVSPASQGAVDPSSARLS